MRILVADVVLDLFLFISAPFLKLCVVVQAMARESMPAALQGHRPGNTSPLAQSAVG